MNDNSTHNQLSDRANLWVLAAVLVLVTGFFCLADRLFSASNAPQTDAVTAVHTVH